ncbi:MAG: hypothetical protein ABII12_03300 [Planctomycetota bacterium]
MKSVDREYVVDARNKLEHALFHLKQAGDNDELRSGLGAAEQSLRCILKSLGDRVHASTCAQRCDKMPGNIVIGVTAHCSCGHVFCDDVVAGMPQP